MIPYFVVLVILAAYGMHRYYLVYAYFKNRHNVPGPPPAVTEWPKVTIQLPIYNERYVIERLVDAVARFDYPRELLDIQVLDDSTDETQRSRARLRRALPGARLADPLPASHRSHRLQGRRAGRGSEIRDGRIRRHLRRRFPALARFSAPHAALFHRPQNRHGAGTLDLPESPLLRADRSRNDPARRPLRHGARRALAQRQLLQLQRHGRRVAPRAPSTKPAAGSTTRSPRTPICPTARSSSAGSFSTCRTSNAPPSCPWK